MNIVVTGASGFIGSALVPHLTGAGHRTIPLRRAKKDTSFECPTWDIQTKESLDAAIHLAGENIAQRWTAKAKKRIRDSRVCGTEWISGALAKFEPRPRTLVCASGVGFYGNRGEEVLTEDSKPGEGFLAEVCREWEAACAPAAKAGIRVVNLRFGVVLDRPGGALKKILPAFRAGFGGRVGSGKQYWSWVTREDVLRVIEFALTNEALRGPINVVAPNAVRNSEFTKALGRALHRPAVLPVPRFALRMLVGEMADEALLSSARAVPQRLQQSGFAFRDPELEPALRKILQSR